MGRKNWWNLDLDCQRETEKICKNIKDALKNKLRRRGLVLGVSGGIDSSLTAALCVKAVGADRVRALLMPERHSAEETERLSKLLADTFGIPRVHENISPILESVSFYKRYNQAVQRVIPEYNENWKSKIVTPNIPETGGYNIFSVVAKSPEGKQVKKRLTLKAYLNIVAATNFKQRIRKMLEYYYADKFNYAVAGTPNRLEYDQGFFVKLGDGAADIKPIAHLYKTQVYKMAEYLGVPEEICNRPPTTDTYSLSQGQDEFYFSLPYEKMDLCLYGKNNGIKISEVADAAELSIEQVKRVYKDIDQKRSTTKYLHYPPILAGDVPEIEIDE